MENSSFKSVTFGGFDKQDVIQYIEKSAADNQAVQEKLQSENTTLQQENDTVKQKNSDLSEQLSLLKRQLQQLTDCKSQLQIELDGAKTDRQELEKLHQQVQQLSSELEQYRPEAEAYRQFRNEIGNIECQARKRAADLERDTQTRLDGLVANFREKYQNLTASFETASGYVTGELRKVEVNLTQLPRALDQIGEDLGELEKSIPGAESK